MFLTLITLLILSSLSACIMTPRKVPWDPMRQPGTKWASEDGSIVFYVEEFGIATGTMRINGVDVDIFLNMGVVNSWTIEIYPISAKNIEDLYKVEMYNLWSCTFKSEKKFIAKVIKSTNGEIGEKIEFHRVDN